MKRKWYIEKYVEQDTFLISKFYKASLNFHDLLELILLDGKGILAHVVNFILEMFMNVTYVAAS